LASTGAFLLPIYNGVAFLGKFSRLQNSSLNTQTDGLTCFFKGEEGKIHLRKQTDGLNMRANTQFSKSRPVLLNLFKTACLIMLCF